MFANKRICITGGSGFLAKALIKRLQKENPASITCVARNEGKLLEVQKDYGVYIMTGDICDRGFVERMMKGKDQVFHLAGFKHLPLGETQSLECVNTNIIGSKNILDASLYSDPEFVLGVSTDKAYNPSNCYGMTKRIMEYLFAQFEREKGNSRTKYRIARYGNVIGSTGSVIPVWRKAIEKGEPIKITDPNMTRFYFSVDDAVQTLIDCLNTQTDATPFIPKMKALRIGDLADAVAGPDYPREIIGNRGSEKMNEGMADGYTSDSVELYTIEEIQNLIGTHEIPTVRV